MRIHGNTRTTTHRRPASAILAIVAMLGLLASACTVAGGASAGGNRRYPQRPISLIVPFSAGGRLDLVARALAPALQQQLGEPVTVTNVTGAGGVTGYTKAATASADGYTLTLASPGIVAEPLLDRNSRYGPDSWTYVGRIAEDPNYLLVPENSPFKTVQDLITYMKAHSGAVTAAFESGYPSPTLSMLFFEDAAGVKFKQVPGFSGSSEVLASVLAGRIDVIFDASSIAVAQTQAHKLRALAVGATEPSPYFPGLVDYAKLGLKNAAVGAWLTLATPKGTPNSVVQRLTEALQAASKTPSLADALKKLYLPFGYLSTSQATAEIMNQRTYFTDAFQRLGIHGQ